MSFRRRLLLPTSTGFLAALFLAGLYFALVSLAESPAHALDFFWQDRLLIIPLILGFGVQASIYTILKTGIFVPVTHGGHPGAMTGASGATSTLAMVACCAHHVTDVLPFLGLGAAAAFLAEYQRSFMLVGLGMTMVSTVVMLSILHRERKKSLAHWKLCTEAP